MNKPFELIENFYYEGCESRAHRLEINHVDIIKEAGRFGGLTGLDFAIGVGNLPSLELFYGGKSPGHRRPVRIEYADGSVWHDPHYKLKNEY